MHPKSLLPVPLVFLALSLPAWATGSLDCVARDSAVKIDVHAVVPYGMGAPLLQLQAEMAAKLAGIAPDLASASFEHAVQYWLDGTSLNLLFYSEREGDGPFGSVEMEIMTKQVGPDEEGTYRGTYRIKAFDVPADGGDQAEDAIEGPIECFAG